MNKVFKRIKHFVSQSSDPRVTAPYATIIDSVILFIVLMVVLGLHSYIYVEVIEKIPESHVTTKVVILFVYIISATLFATTLVGITRYYASGRPLQKLSNAFLRISRGDFSTRIYPRRKLLKNGKKSYIDIMFEDFNTMARELESIKILKDDFISTVSHEFKTPLSLIQGYALTLQNTSLTSEEKDECIKTIIESTERLSKLITNILRLNKLENSAIISSSEPYDLSEEIRRIVLSFEDIYEKKNLTFDVDMDEVIVSYDKELLSLVWNNLVSNAIKFSNSGGRIVITLHSREDGIIFTIKDSGCGIKPDEQNYIFDKFYQVEDGAAQDGGAKSGNGLGLAIVKKALDKIGADIKVKSKSGGGAEFIVRMYLHKVA